jgi:hypothetical protein
MGQVWRSTYSEPNGDMGISGVAGTTSILLIPSRLDDNGVLERAWHAN